jgi:tetratricopeptide (TPR) repeat protein
MMNNTKVVGKLLNEGLDLHKKMELDKARKIYQKIIQLDRNNSNAYHLIGVIGAQENKHDIAIQYIQKAIELNQKNAYFFSNIGNSREVASSISFCNAASFCSLLFIVI